MKTDMQFLVEYSAMVGRSKDEGAQQDPIYIKFYAVVAAATKEAAEAMLCNYSDPGFRCKIQNVTQVTKDTPKELLGQLALKDVIRDQDA